MREYKCDSCGEKIKKRQRYCLRVEMFAAPEVEFDEEDLRQNHKEALNELCRKMKELDPKKLEEDVYICYDLSLCKSCRDKFSARIKYKEII